MSDTFYHRDQKIIVIDGPDMTGKTQIAQALSRELSIPYFKFAREWSEFKGDPSFFSNTVRYAEDYFTAYLRQSGASVIKDRGYPSEWVYARAFGRSTDGAALERIDREFAKLDAKIVLCRRKSYAGIRDDLFPAELGPEKLAEIDRLYQLFVQWTECDVIELFVDDEDLTRELAELRTKLTA